MPTTPIPAAVGVWSSVKGDISGKSLVEVVIDV